jgi:hypothetical protein
MVILDIVKGSSFIDDKHRLCVALSRAIQGEMILMTHEMSVRINHRYGQAKPQYLSKLYSECFAAAQTLRCRSTRGSPIPPRRNIKIEEEATSLKACDVCRSTDCSFPESRGEGNPRTLCEAQPDEQASPPPMLNNNTLPVDSCQDQSNFPIEKVADNDSGSPSSPAAGIETQSNGSSPVSDDNDSAPTEASMEPAPKKAKLENSKDACTEAQSLTGPQAPVESEVSRELS